MKVAVVSGGSSGIGGAVVRKFLNAGYKIFNIDRVPSSVVYEHCQDVLCDLSQMKEVSKAIETITEKCMVLDAFVCNAGVHFSANISESTEQDFDRMININVRSCFFLTKGLLPLMIKQKKGAIVYVGSDQTLIAKNNSALYGLTKAALGSLAKTTALDFAASGIRANLVAPGTIETPLYRGAIQKYAQRSGVNLEEIHRQEELAQPLGRLGQPEEVAELIYFLCSDQAAFITGAIVPIDGGYTAR